MFEGLVRQLILGYLGQYIKDIQKEQLKITLWNEEVLLENVELILEAFDYLQLPFALKQGHVGKLSIKIPWKKLGWDPIIIILEDVVICACQREDKEWSTDAIKRREFAGKKAKLAAAELAKLSRRVCDNQTGKSFVSYMTAKILDGIQVSIRNVHVQYRDMLTASAETLFGLKFSSLTIMRQNPSGVSSGKVRGGQVNKLIKVQGFGFYCSTFQGTSDLVSKGDAMFANHQGSATCDESEDIYILDPVDVSLLLSVNRSGKLEDDAPQYSMNFELTRLVVSVNELQLQQILTIYDYLSTCQLREKYGRYRPWGSPLEKKLKGWQTSWWHYAQESVLSDVKERLRKTSWKYFGHRLKCRRKYVNLYKTKLKCLQQDQIIDEDVLGELEEMEKESDIDDILSYRSAAERELQAFLVSSFSSSGSNSTNSDKSLEDEQTSSKARGWLNWLSRGMLGAGGTDDSSQFSGVISDDVIQDIYEATKFSPVISVNGDSAATDKIFLSSVKLNIREISATLRSLKFGYAIASLVLEDISTDCKIWEESAVVIASINSARILNPRNMQAILFTRKVDLKNDVAEVQQPALHIQLDALPPNADVSLSVKVIIQPMEILCDSQFINSIMEFYYILEHVSFQHERILLSLNGIDDVKARILSKAEFVISSRKRMLWDVNFINIFIVVPWGGADSELHQMVLEAGEVSFLSKGGISSLHSDMENQSFLKSKFINCSTNSGVFLEFQLNDLYDTFQINVTYFEIKILMAYSSRTVPLFEKSSASLTLASCIIPDEPVMKRLDVHIRVLPLLIHFSPSLYKAIMALVTHVDRSYCMSGSTVSKTAESYNIRSNGHMTSHAFWFSITASLESICFQVDLENVEDNSHTLKIYLQMLDAWFDKKEFLECWLSTRAVKIISFLEKSECETLILSSSEHLFASESAEHSKNTFRLGIGIGNFTDYSSLAEGCFLFHYQAYRNSECICHEHRIWSNDIDFHCYPLIVGLLISFFDKLFGCDEPVIGKIDQIGNEKSLPLEPGFEHQKFGFSNFLETGSPECSSIPLDCFPFVTIHNHGSLPSLESTLTDAISEWRKEVSLQDWRSRSPRISGKKEVDSSYAKFKPSYGAESLPQNLNENDVINVDLSLGGIKVHFHDSSCILGTISVPVSKSVFSICDDHFDMLCSTDGLSLSCSWWTQMIHDFLWGPLLPNLSPVFNIRVKKENAGYQKSVLRISFGVQHVSCILPPDYLALLIGYFSLPEWYFGATQQPVCGSSEYVNSEDKVIIDYKFEILDSNLLVPAYLDGSQFLKLDIQQLFCRFIQSIGRDDAMKDIPSEYLVMMTDKIGEKNDCLNIFGRDLSLSLSLMKDDALQSSNLDQVSEWQNLTLIAPLNADVWVIMPYQCETSSVDSSYPTCVMATATNCQLHAEGARVIVGSEALVDVINQFSLINEKSKVVTGDVIQSLKLIRGVVENAACSPEPSSVASTEIRFLVRSMTIRLQQSVKESTISEVIADAEMQFACAASLVNDKLISLDVSFSSLTLFSLLNSVMLAECTTTSPSSSALRVILSVSEQGEHKFDVCLPSLDIWLHIYDWSQVNDVFISFCGELSTNSNAPNSSTQYHKDLIRDVTANVSQDSSHSPNLSSNFTLEILQPDTAIYLLQLEKLGMKVHVPVQVIGDECEVLSKMSLNDSGIKTCRDQRGYVTLTFESKSSEVAIAGETMRLKINLDKARGTAELYGDTDEAAWPLFQLSQIIVEGEIINYNMAHICVKCDTLDVWISSHILHLWSCMQLKVIESGTSHPLLGSVDLEVHLRKLNLLFTHGKWCSSGSLLEIVMRNLLFLSTTTEGEMEGSVEGDLQVNYHNIDKVLWEPFIEPWELQLTIARKHDKSAPLNSLITTEIQLKSKSQLNLNINESLIEVISRTIDMFKDAWREMAVPSEGHGFRTYQINKHLDTGRYAPYIIQNLTSLPLVFYVCKGKLSSGDLDVNSLQSQDGNLLQPGSSVPIYVVETPEEQLFQHRPSQSSDKLDDKHTLQAAHRYILIQFEGTSIPSGPISIDLVGLRYFEVDFSKSSDKLEVDHVRDVVRSNKKVEGDWSSGNCGYVVPVVIDVSVERYSKLIQLYSTVVLLNATPVPLEVRFDIPFGVSPKILDPVLPGHEFPLPLHLAEAGYMRWRPLGNTYLWSEAYSVSNILAHDNKISFLRSIVCYPSHPSSEPFRCCILVNSNVLPSVGKLKKDLYQKQFTENSYQRSQDPDASSLRFIHWMTLSSPLVLKNYLPHAVSLILDNGSVTRKTSLSEVETSFFHIDSSNDLTITLQTRGFKASSLKFPRAETFCSMAKFEGTKYCLSETITFSPELSDGPLCVTIEKRMDPFSGAREVCISVPFLLYNCTGFPLVVSSSLDDMKAHGITMPSCYDLDADSSLGRKDGLALLSSNQDLHTTADTDTLMMVPSESHVLTKSSEWNSSKKPPSAFCSSTFLQRSSQNHDCSARKYSVSTSKDEGTASSQSSSKSTASVKSDNKNVDACMYSPDNVSPGEIMVRVKRCISGYGTGHVCGDLWSSPFTLVPPTGSISVLVPQTSLNTGHVVSVSAAAAPFSGRTRIITFQPRYVISNACNKPLYYKQKGTDFVYLLDAGQHSNIQWTDTTRDLLISVRFDEPGWQWSGGFLPEHLGDTQVKIHNYISNAVVMMRVEVQSADLSIKDEKIVGSPRGNSGTHIILVSVDDTGFMPYRIDNFSKERLRIFQQRCETFETLVNSYTSCPYAWDEPCYPHRLTVEVPGERAIGSYSLDDVKEFSPVYLPATSEKPERTLIVSVHSEGAIKVLSIIDSTYHHLSDLKSPHVPPLNNKKNHAQKHDIFDQFTERVVVEIHFIGISLMNSTPEELLFACAKGVAVDLMQSLDQQKFALQISSLQIDNQLHNTPYPVTLSFDSDNKGHPVNQMKMIDETTKITSGIASDHSHEPAFSLAVAKWRNKDITVVSFEYISLRVADFHLELEQEIVLSLVDFLKTISSRLESRVLHPLFPDSKAVSTTSGIIQAYKLLNIKGKQPFSDERTIYEDQKRDSFLAPVIPIGAPWQQIHLLARQQKKIYVELLDLAPVKLTLSFSSSPWMLRDGVLISGESLIHRGLVALADIEGAQIHLKQLSLSHQLASWESIHEILVRHYTRQFLHEMYKLFGSAGVLGNPIRFARSVSLGIKDFLSVPVRGVFQSPAGLITGMAQGTTSLLSNTVYAISDAATQFSKVAHKGIVAFTFDDQIVANMEKQQKGMTSHSKGLINGFFEGLTGLLQSPIKGAEKHGLPGVLSGIALGVTGLVARPAASILEVTGKTAQSIRNRSRFHNMGSQRLRVRLPRPLSKELALRPYSWEEAVGTSVLAEADEGMKLRDEILVMCKRLKQGGKYAVITERLIVVVSCLSLVDLGKSTFQGIPADPEWVIETDIRLDSIIHADNNEEVVHIVGSNSDTMLRQNQNQHKRGGAGIKGKPWNNSQTLLPLFHANLEFMCSNDAENFLRVLLSTIEKGKEQGWGCVYLIHQSNLK